MKEQVDETLQKMKKVDRTESREVILKGKAPHN
jgi:hypothetical protein